MTRRRKIDRTRTRKEDRPEPVGVRMNGALPPAAPAAAASTAHAGENTLSVASLEQKSSSGKPKGRNRTKAPTKTPADRANKKQSSKRAVAAKKDRSDNKDEGPATKRAKKASSSKTKKPADNDESIASSKSKRHADNYEPPVKKKKRAKKEPVVEEKKRDDDDSFDSADDQISDETKDDSNDDNYEDDSSAGGEEEDEEDVDENESSESEDFVPAKRKARGRTAKTKAATGKAKRSSSRRTAAYDNDTSPESDTVPARGSRRSSSSGRNRSRRAATRARRSQSSDDEIQAGALNDTDSEDIHVEGASTPRRASARKASRKMALLEKEEENEEKEDEHSIPKTWRRPKAAANDDEEYHVEDEAEEESDEDLGSADDEESCSSVARRAAVGVVRDDEIGTAEDSSSDDDEGAVGTRWQSPQLKVQSSPKKRLSRHKQALDDSSSDSVDSPRQRLSTSPPKLPPCPSEFDVITFEPLPAKHVCYFPPGNGDRQCFALETLRKIALSTAHPKFREALTGGSQTFLQPPAFRTAMTDDLLDQIASRFGREALDLHGPFYNRSPSKRIVQVDAAEIESETYGDALDESTTFIEQVRNYVHAQMGSQDIYACPLCYTVAHKRLQSSGKRRERLSDSDCDDETLKERYPATDFENDPMLVLGAVDNDVLEVASAFCFFKVADLKRHLRNDHHVEMKNIKGNEFYETFKIRKVDGLLQRYLKKSFRSVSQGDMQRYWFEGNNFTFVHLLYLIPHAGLCREIIETHDHSDIGFVEKAEAYLQPAHDFFGSFASIAPNLWKIIIEPFRELTQEDVKDFIDTENAENGDETMTSYRALAMEQELESLDSAQERAAYYVNRMKESQSRDDLEESSQEEDDSDDLASSQGELEEPSADEDEWEHKIKSRRGSIGKRTPSKSRSTQTSRRSSLDEDLDQKPRPKESRKPAPKGAGDDSPRSTSRRRVVIEDSDEE